MGFERICYTKQNSNNIKLNNSRAKNVYQYILENYTIKSKTFKLQTERTSLRYGNQSYLLKGFTHLH